MRGGPVLLVASSGGHLAHLLWAAGWWRGVPRAWVTFDTPDARERLAGEAVTWAWHPTNRHPVHLALNAALAAQTLARVRPSVVVTSGAGVAIPFVLAARARGIPSVFLEVIDRRERPSLTARVLARVVDEVVVQVPEQVAALGRGVALGPLPLPPAPPRQRRGERVFVTTGTHPQPFGRLLQVADALAGLGEDVLVQGHGAVQVARHVRLMSASAWEEAVATAAVVITHAGPASILAVRRSGRLPLIVPRDPARGEHVDDHQQRYARDQREGVVVDPVDLVADWRWLRALANVELPATSPDGPVDPGGWTDAFARVVDRVRSR